MSAGNYGKAFAHSLSSLEGIEAGLVVMPTIAPQDRVDLIRSMGCRVEQVSGGRGGNGSSETRTHCCSQRFMFALPVLPSCMA